MERYDQGNRVTVLPPKGRSGIIAIIVLITVIVFAILLIIYLRRRSTSVSSSTGSGSTECVNDIDCPGNNVCDPGSGKCVECISESDCSAEKPFCSGGKCLNCVSNDDCPTSRPICDSLLKQCIQCSNSSDCGGASPLCNPATHRCVGCITSGDCSGTADICDPGSNFCVECLSNAQCTSPAVCNNGQCCDLTAPSITGLSTTSAMPTFHISYTANQSLSGKTAVFQIADSTGFVLFTSTGMAATGSATISQQAPNTFPAYYAGYTYQVRVRLISGCGSTPYSPAASVVMVYPNPPNFNIGIIHAPTSSISLTQIDIRCSSPPESFFFFYQAFFVISTTPFLDPNRSTIQMNVFNTIDANHRLQFISPWPFGVAPGQSYYIRLLGTIGNDQLVVGPPVQFTIPTPPP